MYMQWFAIMSVINEHIYFLAAFFAAFLAADLLLDDDDLWDDVFLAAPPLLLRWAVMVCLVCQGAQKEKN